METVIEMVKKRDDWSSQGQGENGETGLHRLS